MCYKIIILIISCVLFIPTSYSTKVLVSPIMEITSIPLNSDTENLTCHVRGFYPRDIYVSWLERHGVRVYETYKWLNIQSNPNGTFETQISIIANKGARNKYCCVVRHRSLKSPVRLFWPKKNNDNEISTLVFWFAVISWGLAIVAIIGLIIKAVFAYCEKRNWFQKLNSDSTPYQKL